MTSKLNLTKTFLDQCGLDSSEEKIKSSFSHFWYNIRSKNSGYRLTDQGLETIIQSKIRTYEIKLPEDFKITAQILIWLDRQLKSPYHLDKNKITVLGEIDAIEIHLFSGDIKKMGLSKSLAKRFNQD